MADVYALLLAGGEAAGLAIVQKGKPKQCLGWMGIDLAWPNF